MEGEEFQKLGVKRKRIDLKLVLIIVLSLALVATVSVIFFQGYIENQEKKCDDDITSVKIEVAKLVQKQILDQLYQESLKCQQMPIRFNNQTIQIVGGLCSHVD